MNLAEVHDLLTYVAALDNRRFGDDTVIAWHGIVADLELADCREAVRRHFGRSGDYLMPVHIVRGAEEILRERRRAAWLELERQREALEPAPPPVAPEDRSAETQALIAELRDSLPAVDERKVRRAEVLEWDKAREREARATPNPRFVPAAIAPAQPSEESA